MLDVSDGLLRDAKRLADAGGAGLDLDLATEVFGDELATLAPAAAALGADATDWVLTGGEDHGLLATFPPGVRLPEPFRPIGRVVDRPGLTVGGQVPSGPLGWDHFGR